MCEYDCDEHCQEHVVTKRENEALDDELKQNKSAYLKAVETIHELKAEIKELKEQLKRGAAPWPW